MDGTAAAVALSVGVVRLEALKDISKNVHINLIASTAALFARRMPRLNKIARITHRINSAMPFVFRTSSFEN